MSTEPDQILSFEGVKLCFVHLAPAFTHSPPPKVRIEPGKKPRRKSEETRQNERRPIVNGEVFPCGTIIADLGTDKHGNCFAAFKCSHCQDSGIARFSDICSTSEKRRTRSCNCLQKAAFKRIHRSEFRAFSAEKRREVVESCRLTSSVRAAKHYGLSKASTEILRKDEYNRIDAMPEDFRQMVYLAAQDHAKSTSYSDLDKRFGLTAAEVRRICVVLHAERVEKQERLMKAWEARSFKQRHEYEHKLLPLALDYAWAAIERVNDADEEFKQVQYVEGRYRGEFSQGELTLGLQQSAFCWVYNLCEGIPEQVLAEPWARDLRRFLEIADQTILMRKRRRLSAINRAQEPPEHRRRKVTCPTDVDLQREFPTPSYDHNTMIEAMMVCMPARSNTVWPKLP